VAPDVVNVVQDLGSAMAISGNFQHHLRTPLGDPQIPRQCRFATTGTAIVFASGAD